MTRLRNSGCLLAWLSFFCLIASGVPLAQINPYQKGLEALARSFPEVAVRHFETTLERSDLTASQRQEVILRLAESLLRAGEYQKCLTLLSKERSKLPNEQYYWRASASLFLGKVGSASLSLKTYEKDPTNRLFLSAVLNEALLQSLTNNTAGALQTLQQLPADHPQRLLHTARYALQIGRYDLATEALDSLQEERYWHEKTVLRASLRKAQGQYEEALTLLQAAPPAPLDRQGREALALQIECLLETNPPAAFPPTARLISASPPGEPLGPLFDTFLLTSDSQDQSQVQAVLERWIQTKGRPLLPGYALFTKALLQSTAEEKGAVLSELYEQFPAHPLAQKAKILAADLIRRTEGLAASRAAIQSLLSEAQSDYVKALLSAWLAELAEGPEKSQYYEAALQWASPINRGTLQFNLALSQLEENGAVKIEEVPTELRGELLIARSAKLADTNPAQATALLEQFLRENPASPLVSEAQFRLAQLLIDTQSAPLLEQGKSLVAGLEIGTLPPFLKEEVPTLQAKLALALEDRKSLEELASHPFRSERLLLRIADFLYREESYYSAQLSWEALLQRSEIQETKELARYYGALTQLKIGTSAYTASAYRVLEEITQKEGPYQQGAREVLAASYLSENKIEEALALLADAKRTTETILLKARAYTKQSKPEPKKKAAALYHELLADDSLPLSTLYTVAYQLILYYEQTGQYGDAIDLYYKVANFETLPAPVTHYTWSLYYRIGERGLALFEERGRWRTAHQFAKVLTQVEGPRHEWFVNKAKRLSLENMIWEE